MRIFIQSASTHEKFNLSFSLINPLFRKCLKTGWFPKNCVVDGTRLAELMIEHDIGVSKLAGYEIKRKDSDFFEE